MGDCAEGVYVGSVEMLAGNAEFMGRLEKLNADCPWLDGLSKEELLSRAGVAEATIREQSNILRACLERLVLIAAILLMFAWQIDMDGDGIPEVLDLGAGEKARHASTCQGGGFLS